MPPRATGIPAEKLRQYVSQGMTARQIADRTGRSRDYIYKLLNDQAIDWNRERKKGAT